MLASIEPAETVVERVQIARELAHPAPIVAPQTRVRDVEAMFRRGAGPQAVVVAQDARPEALVIAHKLRIKLSQQYGYSLFGNKPIIQLAERRPLLVDEYAQVSDIVGRVLARDRERVFDDIIVVDPEGRCRGLINVHELLLEHHAAFGMAVARQQLSEERAEELERIARMKSQFIAQASHELRAPVNVLVGIVEILQSRLESDEEGLRLLRVAMSTGMNLRSLINNILNLSKLEAGRLEIWPERVDLAPMMKNLAAETEILLGNKANDVAVRVQVAASAGALYTDEVKLRQVILNLLSNAAKFTNRGYIDITVQSAAAGVRIEVADTGPGIPEHELARIFQPFEQVGEVKSKRVEGSGLGLAITRHLVELLGGRLDAESSPGTGSLFWIELPNLQPESTEDTPCQNGS